MTNKKTTIKRLVIYLLISFGLPYLMIFIYIANFGWTLDNRYYGVMASGAMLSPAIANILTRIITKEGLSELYLSFRTKKVKRYFTLAILLPISIGIINAFITSVFMLPEGSTGDMLKGIDYGSLASTVLYLIATSIASLMFGFGEEFGWRGYLTPKLEKLLPAPAAILLSGIIWGLWHAPLIACGHNFGKNYPGDPWLGIALMCVSCTAISFYLTALTKATGSSLTAGLAHIAINDIVGAAAGLMLTAVPAEKLATLIDNSFSYAVLNMGVMSFIALAVGIFILLKNRTNKQRV